jgi:uncharacterized protein (TIGR02466 family)
MVKQDIFSQFILADLLNLDVDAIKKYAYQMKQKSGGRIRSNNGGWQSYDLEKTEFEKKYFLDFIQSKIDESKQLINVSFNLTLLNSWININNKTNFNMSHVHPASFISGVVYIKVPENSGRILFKNPIGNLIDSYLEYWHVRDKTTENVHFSPEWFIQPKENLILLFPSWVEHYVEPNNNFDDRISISFNIGVKNNGT